MTAWWGRSAVLFDTETDGPDPKDARVIQAAVVGVGQATVNRTWLVKPERDIPQGAIDVHHIETEFAAMHGETRELAVFQIAAAVAAHAVGDVPVIAHNAPYDLTLLDREMRRLGIGSLGIEPSGQVAVRMDGRTVGAFWVIDTIVLDRALDPFRKGPEGGGRNRLEEACRVYGVPMPADAAHDAANDALGAGRLAWAIAKRCAMPSDQVRALYADRRHPHELSNAFWTLGTLTLPQLHAYQQRMAKEQGEHLQDYFAEHPERGVNPADVSTDWPLIPVSATVDIAL
jgi:DNA polymerase III subunit epsilon